MAHAPAERPVWPVVEFDDVYPTVEFVHRIGQIAGKYTLSETFEPAWGHIAMVVNPRGFRTPSVRSGAVDFEATYDLVGDQVHISTVDDVKSVALRVGMSVADLYGDFVGAAGALGILPPSTPFEVELADGKKFAEDTTERHYDSGAATAIATAMSRAARAFGRWQAPFIGYRPPVGLMWGGFDIAATRYRGRGLDPPADRPIFQQNGMNGEVVALGFWFGDPSNPSPGFYGYTSPPAPSLATADLSGLGATWVAEAGMAVLPWASAAAHSDPDDLIVRFGDAVYEAALRDGQWQEPRTIDRHPGPIASNRLVPWPTPTD